MNKRNMLMLLTAAVLTAGLVRASEFGAYCQSKMDQTGVCPEDICILEKVDDSNSLCIPKPCDQFQAGQCPLNYCDVLTNCRGDSVCHFKMIDPPECGNVSYAGQDVACCPGLVRRCGVAFSDDTCDMYGDNSEYNLPICIPCGDGICTNFENVCNCPEDCWPDGDREYEGQKFDEE